MPVSPQDFALWSDLTGNPYPRTPAERMALAPEVYSFTRNLGKQSGPTMSPLRRTVDVIGKAALAAGALAGAAYLGDKYIREREEKGEAAEPETGVAGLLTGAKTPAESIETPAPIAAPSAPRASTEQIITALGRAKASPYQAPTPQVEADVYDKDVMDSYLQHQWQTHRRSVSERAAEYLGRTGTGYQKLELDDEPGVPTAAPVTRVEPASQVVQASGDITPPTTAQRFQQSVIPDQTVTAQVVRGQSPVKPTTSPIEAKPLSQSAVISSQQSFSPGTEIEMVGEDAAQKAAAFRKSAAYAAMQKQYPELQPISSSSEPASAAPESLTNVQPSPQIRVAQPTDVGAALKSKGIYLSGDLESGTIQVNTEKGGTFEINHPYATHPKRAIRETALQEEQMARNILQSAGVTSEQAKDYWASKFSKPSESPIAAMAKPSQAPVTASVSDPSPSGASPAEIRELDALLSRSHARHTPEQRVALRDQLLAQKYGGGGSQPIVTPTQPAAVRVARETSEAPIEMPSPVSGPSPESVRFARETARGMSRMGLMAQKEAGRAQTASRAQFGPEVGMEAPGESRELADPSALRAMMQRQSTMTVPRYF